VGGGRTAAGIEISRVRVVSAAPRSKTLSVAVAREKGRPVRGVRRTITVVLLSSALAAVVAWSAANANPNSGGTPLVPRGATATPYTSVRIDAGTRLPYEKLVQNFNAYVPQINLQAYVALVARHASWSQVVAEAHREAGPVGFVWFEELTSCAVFDLAPRFSSKCVVYTVGDPALADTMVRHDTRAVVYLPTKFLLYSDSRGRGHVVYVLPSSSIGGLRSSLRAQTRKVDQRFKNLVDRISR
jgi:hypothetical protein